MSAYGLFQQGGFHEWENCPCQDRVFVCRIGDTESTTVCDGAGDMQNALKAADSVSREIGSWACANFTELMHGRADARAQLLDEIDRILDKFTFGTKAYRNAYGCTLLCVCRSLSTGEALVIQIGDGVILRYNDRREIVCVNRPDARSGHRASWLVNNSREGLMKHAHIRRDPPSRGGGYCLLSDGSEGYLYMPSDDTMTVHPIVPALISEHLLYPRRFAEEMPDFVKKRIRPTDDFSIGIIGDVPASILPLPAAVPRRIAKKYAVYISARRAGKSPITSAREAGIRRRDLPKCMKRLTGMGIEEV